MPVCLKEGSYQSSTFKNDSVSDEEIKFGDNGVLSALLASLGMAELLVILSTAQGLMTHPDAGRLIPFVKSLLPSSKWPKAPLARLPLAE